MLLLTVLLSQSALALDRTAGSADLHFEGPTAYGYVGESSSTGDINGDGNSDILLGAPALGSLGSNGVVYLLSGPLGGKLSPAEATATISGTNSGDQAGFSVHGRGDFDGDGTDDILIGAPYNDGETTNGGRVYLFYGPVSGTLSASAADVIFTGTNTTERFGWALASLDVDQDGTDDVVASAPYYSSSRGRVYIWEGGALSSSNNVSGADYTFTGKSGSGEEAGYALTVGAFANGGDNLVISGPSRDYGGGSTDNGTLYFLASDGSFPSSGNLDAVADHEIAADNSVTRLGQRMASGFSADVTFAGDELLACNDNGECLFFEDPSANAFTDYAAQFNHTGGYAPELRVADAGDVDGDGIGDFMLADPEDDYDGDSDDEGTVFLFYGTGNAYSGTYLLDNTDADVFFAGGSDLDEFGGAIASGDINNDGKSDILVTAPQDDIGAGTDRGSAYLFYGPFDPIAGIIDLDDADTVIDGDDADDWSGHSIAGLGDINCDGVDDFATGGILADESATSTGAVYIFFGPTPESGELDWLNTFLGASDADIVFYGDAASDLAGNNIAGVGDLNDDGCADFAIAAAGNDGSATDAGAVYLFYGTASFPASLDSSDADATFEGAAAGDTFGYGLRGGGDFDGDGIDDMVVGAPYNDGAAANAGAAYVFLGASGGGAWSGTVGATSADCVYRGVAANDWAGWSFATGFDFDDDGWDDLAIGSPGVDDGLGSNTGLVALFYNTACSGTASVSTADTLIQGKLAGEQFGFSLAAGDVDDDGYDDLVVGAPYSTYDIVPGEDGSVYWIPGRSSLTGTVRAPALGVQLCTDAEVRFGWAVDAGDVDAEAGAEILVGAPWFSVAETRRGNSYVWYGSTIAGWENDGLCHVPATAEVKLTGEDAYDYAGWSIAALGDLNQDGEEDIGVGAFGSERGLTNQGAAYVVLSSH